jgi:cytochrome c-type biogenesis protein CcmH
MLANPALEARARVISAELRCLVCQNQSIDDSDAPLARDLRVIVRERLSAGDSDDAVKQWLVSRYGSYVLLRPPLQWDTAALWLGPAALLAIGSVLVFRAVRRRRGLAETAPLSAAETAALDRLLGPNP